MREKIIKAGFLIVGVFIGVALVMAINAIFFLIGKGYAQWAYPLPGK